jgi:integrase
MKSPDKLGYYRHSFHHGGKRYITTGKTKAEAIKKAALKEAALKRGEIGISNNMTVRRWSEEWLETYKKGNVTDKSYSNDKRFITVLSSAIGNMRLKDVRDIHLQKILNERRGKSRSDVLHLRNIIRAVFRQARISRLIPYDPSESLTLPSAIENKRRSVTESERSWILKTASAHHAGLWVKMMLYCGLRPGELMALQWKDIDFNRGVVRISKAKESGKHDIKAPKTDAGNRSVPIPSIYLSELRSVCRSPFEFMFIQKTKDSPLTETSFYCAWHSFLRDMDIAMGAKVYRNQIIYSLVANDLSPYCLRHTYCTDLEAAGVPINVAKELMGHSDITVTANIYTHKSDRALTDAAQKINAFHMSM